MIRYSLDERIAHVAAWRCSGLTGRQYASQHDIKFSTFRNWPRQSKNAQAKNSGDVIMPVKVIADEKCLTSPTISTATQSFTAHESPVSKSATNMTSSVVKGATASSLPNQHALSGYGDAPPHYLTSSHNELSVLLPSGLVVKCQLTQLPDVVAMMEVRYDA